MGKIRVQDLAKMMGIPNQDLVFKLKSIGVRVEGDDAHIDTDIIQAILQGKKLPHPREVILRDEPVQEDAAALRRRRTARRMPINPLRPTRPRTMIQKVEPRIPTLPVTEKPRLEPEKAAEQPAAAAQKAAARPVEVEPLAEPAAVGEGTHAEREEAKERRKPKRRKPVGPSEDEELATFRGRVEDLEAEDEEEGAGAAAKTTTRRHRRAERRQETEESGKVLHFTKGKPEGPVMIGEGMTVREFSDKLGVKAKDLIKALFSRGILANINHVLEPELAQQLAVDLGVEARVVSFEEEVQAARESARPAKSTGTVNRAPVVTIMGHVDHGKTSLLDAIRESKITESEHGGITQHIGAYDVEVDGKKIVFVDTPGHEAFTRMRARGAQVTDIVVLVVAADDGVMPQTVEAIDHARAAGVPIVVAINKIDKDNANPDRVKKELADHELLVEDWGGQVVSVAMSALKRQGIRELLEMILLTADLLELKSDPELPGNGVVLEARKEVGRGVVATVLVQNGVLRVGDVFVSGATWGRVRAMSDDLGERLDEAGASTPVEVSGFNDVPQAGDLIQVVEDESKARGVADYRHQEERQRTLIPTAGKMSLDQLFVRIQEGEVKELPVVVKADVQGSVEVLKDTLSKLSTDKVKVVVIHSGVAAISTNDVLLASASEALIIGFNVRPERSAVELAEKEEVEIRLHTVIYELTEELRKAMTGLLEPTFREVASGRAEVRETFKVPKAGTIAGCHVVEGVIPRSALIRLLRDNVVVYEGKIASLRRFKDDVSEVRSGFDCGIGLDRFQDVKPGDVIEAYVREEVAPSL
jgi:translation initiation factor IF-2